LGKEKRSVRLRRRGKKQHDAEWASFEKKREDLKGGKTFVASTSVIGGGKGKGVKVFRGGRKGEKKRVFGKEILEKKVIMSLGRGEMRRTYGGPTDRRKEKAGRGCLKGKHHVFGRTSVGRQDKRVVELREPGQGEKQKAVRGKRKMGEGGH